MATMRCQASKQLTILILWLLSQLTVCNQISQKEPVCDFWENQSRERSDKVKGVKNGEKTS